ncbi:MAG: hypothetical protein KAJ19_21960 [Gammaproteobacteria bacterium]|nr:hypothetical protein [Gammaproteobacteria bacterium]
MAKMTQQQLEDYKTSLSAEEQECCCIAEEYLGSSFDLAKSGGFLIWLKKNRPLIYPDGQYKTKKIVIKKKKKKKKKSAGSE